MFSNMQWLQTVELQLTVQGYDPNQTIRALSAYLANHPLSCQDMELVRAGIAAAGYPPDTYFLHHGYTAARERWIQTGDINALRDMIDAVTIDDPTIDLRFNPLNHA